MHKVPATFTVALPETERSYRSMPGNFRSPPYTYKPGQIASEMALAACGVLYLRDPQHFSIATLKHIAYLHNHMTPAARPRIILAFAETHPFDPNTNAHSHLTALFTDTVCP